MLHIEKKLDLFVFRSKIKSYKGIDECISLDIFLGLYPIISNYVKSVS